MTAILVAEATTVAAAQVTFHADKYGCELSVDNQPRRHGAPDAPLTTPLQGGGEYLVECEGHDIPVKMYSRNYVGRYSSADMPADVTIHPVAVTAIADNRNLDCKVKKENPSDDFQEESTQIPPAQSHLIARGTPQLHCGDTNLIEVSVDGAKAWFRNRDFAFSYNDQIIPLYSPSQDFECCWIN